MNTNLKNVGRNLKMLLYDHNVTQKMLAQELGISENAVSMIVKGDKLPSLAVTAKIAAYFKVSIDSIVSD